MACSDGMEPPPLWILALCICETIGIIFGNYAASTGSANILIISRHSLVLLIVQAMLGLMAGVEAANNRSEDTSLSQKGTNDRQWIGAGALSVLLHTTFQIIL